MERFGLVGGDSFAAGVAEVEDSARSCGGDVSEDGARGPLGVAGEVGEAVQEPDRQVGEPDERDAPHRCQCFDVGKRAVRRSARADAERVREIGEAVRAQARQRDAHDFERVDPGAAKRVAAGHPLDEGAVEARVVRDDVAARR